MRASSFGSMTLLMFALAISSPVAAAPDTAPSEAAKLYDQGLKDMLAGRYETGCAALQKSHELEPLPGAAFTLAECLAKAGRLVEARERYQEYLDVVDTLDASKKERQRGRRERAIEQIASIDERAPKLVLTLPPDAPPGTSVRLDGKPFAASRLGKPTRVDPGTRVVVVSRPSGAKHEQRVTVVERDQKTVALSLPTASDGDEGGRGAGDAMRIGGIAGLAVGGVGIVIGAITGGLVFSEKATIDANCDGPRCNADGKAAGDAAQSLATVSTATLIAGGVLAAAGGVVFVLAPSADDETDTAGRASWGVAARGAAGGGQLTIEGTW